MSAPYSAHTLLYQSQLLASSGERLIHGFTGKPASFGGPDTPTNPRSQVLENRRKLLADLGISSDSWRIPTQVHGHRIGRAGDNDFAQTDGILLMEPYQPVMLLYADCVPVMLYDAVHHAGVVVHAGWRGTRQHIAKEALIALQNAVGSQPGQIVAAIGPAISLCCFQVSMPVAEEVAESLEMPLEEMEARRFLAWDAAYPENPRLDLKAINAYQLAQAGVTQIDTLPHCTRCLESELFSYRRGEDGRNSAFMVLKE